MTTVPLPVSGNSDRTLNRRSNGTGSLSLRKDGAFDVRVSLPGKRRRRRIVHRLPDERRAQHRRRAEAVAESMLGEIREGHVLPSGHVTIASYVDAWLASEGAKTAAGRGLAEATLDFYGEVFGYYVVPHVGSRPLPSLTIGEVEEMMNTLAALGRSPRTIQAARNALGRLLRAAKREGLVAHVVTDGTSQIRRTLADEDGPTAKALRPDQIRRLFDAAAGTKWEPLLATLALLGIRRGEALGLSWSDVDLEAGVVTIRRSLSRVGSKGASRLVLAPTKTRSSRRPLPIPPVLASLLRAWQVEQARERLKLGEAWGGPWTAESLIFTTPLGTPVDPDNLRHALDRLGKDAGIGHVHPHQLRHSVASLLIAEGYTPPEVAKVMGHSSPAVTLAFYSHAFDSAGVRAMTTVADAFSRRPAVGGGSI
jgi:integrase